MGGEESDLEAMHKAGACAEADLKFANKKFSPASFCILLMIGFNSGVRDAIGEKNGFMWEKFPIHILIFVFVITNIKVTNMKEIPALRRQIVLLN